MEGGRQVRFIGLQEHKVATSVDGDWFHEKQEGG
jgi:hypothetical protein